MDREKQREIASKGGRAAHAKGTAHEFTPEEARIAGRKGGESSRGGRRNQSRIESEGSGLDRGADVQPQAAPSPLSSPMDRFGAEPSIYGESRGEGESGRYSEASRFGEPRSESESGRYGEASSYDDSREDRGSSLYGERSDDDL